MCCVSPDTCLTCSGRWNLTVSGTNSWRLPVGCQVVDQLSKAPAYPRALVSACASAACTCETGLQQHSLAMNPCHSERSRRLHVDNSPNTGETRHQLRGTPTSDESAGHSAAQLETKVLFVLWPHLTITTRHFPSLLLLRVMQVQYKPPHHFSRTSLVGQALNANAKYATWNRQCQENRNRWLRSLGICRKRIHAAHHTS